MERTKIFKYHPSLLLRMSEEKLYALIDEPYFDPEIDNPIPCTPNLQRQYLKMYWQWVNDPFDRKIDKNEQGYWEDRLWCFRQMVRVALVIKNPSLRKSLSPRNKKGWRDPMVLWDL